MEKRGEVAAVKEEGRVGKRRESDILQGGGGRRGDVKKWLLRRKSEGREFNHSKKKKVER